MKRKFYILGLLAILCLLGTGYNAWTLYDAHLKQVAEWNEGAKAAFEEALWMEVNKRAEIPNYHSYSNQGKESMLNENLPDSVYVTTSMGRKAFKINRSKYENSLIKEREKRVKLGILLLQYPLSLETIKLNWDSLLLERQIASQNQIRYIYTDWFEQNDTLNVGFEGDKSLLDSLTVKYMGIRCEHEITAYISSPHWVSSFSWQDGCIYFIPWLLLVLLYIFYSHLVAFVRSKLVREKVVEKTIEVKTEVVVEKKVHLASIKIEKAQTFELPDGTIFDAFACTLEKDGLQQRLQPQSVSLLKLFLSKSDYKITSADICIKLWGDVTYTERLYSAIRRLRSDLKKVKSELFIETSYGFYELKSPISS